MLMQNFGVTNKEHYGMFMVLWYRLNHVNDQLIKKTGKNDVTDSYEGVYRNSNF